MGIAENRPRTRFDCSSRSRQREHEEHTDGRGVRAANVDHEIVIRRFDLAVYVTVRDNGSGISPEIKEKNLFTVLHDQTARNGSRSADRETNGI